MKENEKYNAEAQASMEVDLGERSGGDIRHNSFNANNQHYGTTGADNDNSVSASGKLEDLVGNAPVKDTFEFKGVEDGQQSPYDGKANL